MEEERGSRWGRPGCGTEADSKDIGSARRQGDEANGSLTDRVMIFLGDGGQESELGQLGLPCERRGERDLA